MLSDTQLNDAMITNALDIQPVPNPKQIQPASIDLRLSNEFAFHQEARTRHQYIDPRRDTDHENPSMEVVCSDVFWLKPLGFCLARTMEFIRVGSTLGARVEGKSTLGRYGLMIHATAGFVDPGFEGTITLELFNCTSYPIRLEAGMAICQLAVTQIQGQVARPYGHPDLGSRYQGQYEVTLAK